MSDNPEWHNWVDRAKRHWLLAALIGPMLVYGIVKGGGEVIAYFIAKSATERSEPTAKKQPNKSIETGSVKPPQRPQHDPYTRCLEERHAELAKTRLKADEAKSELGKCVAAFKKQYLFPSELDALAHCHEYNRAVIANEAVGKSIEQRVCRR